VDDQSGFGKLLPWNKQPDPNHYNKSYGCYEDRQPPFAENDANPSAHRRNATLALLQLPMLKWMDARAR
jgi:hypothetical protein